ncbi:citrate lyase subunit beta [Candidatus Gastranaerophilus sp. (ex Termes propinquus)]|nr:citrate lyase subunit beta [Candidatus Gastranaerophilus sp. (ex Termes propinquus)]
MNTLEKNMVKALVDLKENHHVIGVKAEFEAEGTRLEEALRLKEVTTRAGLDLTIKIGGCEALKDMYDARTIGVNAIVAPMIESSYALKKYIQSTKLAFPRDEHEEIDFFINIETITGFENIDSILSATEADYLSGIVLGRVDMAGSLGLSREDINSRDIFEIAEKLAEKTQKYNKKLVIGGGVSAHSLPFFERLSEGSLYKFETRKIIFDAQKALKDPNADKGILKAVGFELMWLQNKRDFYGMIYNEDKQRLEMLESRYKKLIDEAGKVSN